MKRLMLICSAGVAAAGLAAAPAMAGLAGNTSFSHQLPVHVPQQARIPQLAAHEGDASTVTLVVPSGTPTKDDPNPSTGAPEPGDDQGSTAPETEPGDDNGVDQDETETSTTPEPGEDSPGATESEHDSGPSPTVTPGTDGGQSGSGDGGGSDGSGGASSSTSSGGSGGSDG